MKQFFFSVQDTVCLEQKMYASQEKFTQPLVLMVDTFRRSRLYQTRLYQIRLYRMQLYQTRIHQTRNYQRRTYQIRIYQMQFYQLMLC